MIDFTGKKFGLISLGCDKNRVDSEKALAIISSRGGVITNDAEDEIGRASCRERV